MQIEYLYIKNFRGISSLEWHPAKGLNCLIGPGDSCKTTILDAIELLLAERQIVTFDDLDFFDAKPSNTIEIEAVISKLPADFLRDDRYGLLLSGWNPEKGEWFEEPAEQSGVFPALTLQLTVDESLEPSWYIYLERDPDNKSNRVRTADRKMMAPSRLGVYADRHLSWGRSSALQRIGSHPEKLPSVLNSLLRTARDSFAAEGAKAFSETLEVVSPDIASLGVQVRHGVGAILDYTSLSANASGVTLHDGNIPFRCMGTGSARLAVAALQSAESAHRQFLLVDELEYGLEPHRISLLVSHLRNRVKASGQVFLTTHSTTVLREVRFDEVFICRRDPADGNVTVKRAETKIAKKLNGMRYVRDKGEALLARSVLVCEGQTEVALLKGFAEETERPFQARDVALVDGGGSDAAAVAFHLASLGYRTAMLTDSDNPLKDAVVKALQKVSVSHFQWDDKRCTEEELFCGIPAPLRKDLLALIGDHIDPRRVLGELSILFNEKFGSLDAVNQLLDDDEAARKIGRHANENKWIKTNYDLCFELGTKIAATASLVGGTLDSTLESVYQWFDNHA